MHPTKKRENATTRDTDSVQHLVDAFRKNPDDPLSLLRLVQALNRAGMYTRAIDLIKKVILNVDLKKKSERYQETVNKCARITYFNLANSKLDQNQLDQALKIYSELIGVMKQVNQGFRESDPEFVKITRGLPDNQYLQTRTFQRLLSVLLRRNEISKAGVLLSRKDCLITYTLAVRIIQAYAANSIKETPQNIKKPIALLDKFLTLLGVSDDRESVIEQSIYSNIMYPLSPWREKILSRYDLEDMQKWISVSGFQKLETYKKQGKGIILVSSHMSTGRALNLLLDRMGYVINALEARDRMGNFGVQSTGNMRVFEIGEKARFPLRELYQIQKLLKKGEIANLSGDGFRGSTGVPVNFLGRKREFKTSFAELALKTDAVALPVFGSAHPSGKITLEINEPLPVGDKKLQHHDRVKLIIKEYAALLEGTWRKNPGDIAWEQIKYYFSLPEID